MVKETLIDYTVAFIIIMDLNPLFTTSHYEHSEIPFTKDEKKQAPKKRKIESTKGPNILFSDSIILTTAYCHMIKDTNLERNTRIQGVVR